MISASVFSIIETRPAQLLRKQGSGCAASKYLPVRNCGFYSGGKKTEKGYRGMLSPLPTAGGGIASLPEVVVGTANFTIKNHPQLLRAKQVAQILNISTAMAYRLLQQGKLTSIRIGNSVRVLPDDLEAYIQSRRSNKPLAG